MALQPMDLQMLFSQVEKVGKEQYAHKDALALQQNMLGAQIVARALEKQDTISETKDDERMNGINDETARRERDKKRQREREQDARRFALPVASDPLVGSFVDLSG